MAPLTYSLSHLRVIPSNKRVKTTVGTVNRAPRELAKKPPLAARQAAGQDVWGAAQTNMKPLAGLTSAVVFGGARYMVIEKIVAGPGPVPS